MFPQTATMISNEIILESRRNPEIIKMNNRNVGSHEVFRSKRISLDRGDDPTHLKIYFN